MLTEGFSALEMYLLLLLSAYSATVGSVGKTFKLMTASSSPKDV